MINTWIGESYDVLTHGNSAKLSFFSKKINLLSVSRFREGYVLSIAGSRLLPNGTREPHIINNFVDYDEHQINTTSVLPSGSDYLNMPWGVDESYQTYCLSSVNSRNPVDEADGRELFPSLYGVFDSMIIRGWSAEAFINWANNVPSSIDDEIDTLIIPCVAGYTSTPK